MAFKDFCERNGVAVALVIALVALGLAWYGILRENGVRVVAAGGMEGRGEEMMGPGGMRGPGPGGMMRPPREGGAPAARGESVARYDGLLNAAKAKQQSGAVPETTVWRLQLARDAAWIRANSFGGRGGFRQSPAADLLKSRYYAVMEPLLTKAYEDGTLPLENFLAALAEQEAADASAARLKRRAEEQGADSDLAKAIAAFDGYPKTAATDDQLRALVEALRPQPRP